MSQLAFYLQEPFSAILVKLSLQVELVNHCHYRVLKKQDHVVDLLEAAATLSPFHEKIALLYNDFVGRLSNDQQVFFRALGVELKTKVVAPATSSAAATVTTTESKSDEGKARYYRGAKVEAPSEPGAKEQKKVRYYRGVRVES